MPRVKQVKARKDYPEFGIKKGDVHYFTQLKTGPRSSKTLRQIEKFKRSQLTTSEYLSELYDWEDALGEVSSPDDLEGLIEQIQTLGESQQEKADNMPDSLREGDTGTLLEERASACKTAASELELIKDDWETAISDHEESGEEEAFDDSEFKDQVANVYVDA